VRAAVLIVNYRTYDALDRALASLMPHLGDDDEAVVIDWESDQSHVARLSAMYARVRIVSRDPNRGFAAGVNAAAALTSAPVLILLNPDTEVEGPLVRTLADWCAAHPDCAVVGPRVLNRDGTIQPSARRFPGWSTVLGGRSTWLTRRFPNNWFSRHNLLSRSAGSGDATMVDWVAGSCFATPRRVFEQLGGLDEGFFMYWEDADYCRRATAAGGECHYLPMVSVRHVGGASSAHNVVPSIRAFHRSAFRLFWKHARVARVMAPVVWLGLRLRSELKVARR
jgi:GT2 family glycosyltransferase